MGTQQQTCVAAGLLLWARRVGDIDRLLHDQAAAACGGRMRAVPRYQLTYRKLNRLVKH